MPYTYITFSDLKSRLAEMLGDTQKVSWTDTELGDYIKEALSTLSVACLTSRERVTFSLTASTSFYDLSQSVSSQLGYSSTDRTLINLLNRSLLEPQITSWGSAWAGSEQFTLTQIVAALERARDDFLLRSGMVVTLTDDNTLVQTSRVQLPDTTLDVRRVAWKSHPAPHVINHLSQEDPSTLSSYRDGWNTDGAARLETYSIVGDPALTLQLAPPPTDIGSLHLLTIKSGPALAPTSGTNLSIPEGFYWALKYGALADLLGPHSHASDPARARYCRRRFREALELARHTPSVLHVELNGRAVTPEALVDWDFFDQDWQNLPIGTPSECAVASWNLIAVKPAPASSSFSITLDLVRNPVLPSSDTSKVEIDRAHLEVLLDFARHLALFKFGGREFADSLSAYDRLIRLAFESNSRLQTQARQFESMRSLVELEDARRPSGVRRRPRRSQDEIAEDEMYEEVDA